MKVRFEPSGEEHEIQPDQSVLELAQKHGIFIKTVCNGAPSCAECRIRVTDGEAFALPPSKEELNLIGTAHYIENTRLSCQLKCFGDIVVNLEEQVEKQKNIKVTPPGVKMKGDQKSRARQDILALDEKSSGEEEE